MAWDKRIRKNNFSVDELICLRENYTEHREMLQSKLTNSLANKMKNDAWKKITSSVITLGVKMSGVEEVRKKWNNLCLSAKLAYHVIHKKREKTGGGTPPLDLSEETAHIVDMMKDKSSFVGIDHGIDSFNINV